MNRLTVILLGMALAIIGGIKIWFHVSIGAVLTLEGCQGGTFTIPLGASSVHCWGCYAVALGTLICLASSVRFIATLENMPNLLKIKA